jgi:hypothetical protein
MIQVTEHFTYEELISSQKAAQLGIDNSHPSPEILSAASHTAICMETVRTILGDVPIHVDSWIRCPLLNTAVGSHPTSQHIKGEAVDFIAPIFGTPLDIAKRLIAEAVTVRFDQLIMEGTWVHISFCSPTSVPRNEVLSLLNGGKYAFGLTDKEGNKL